MFSDSSGDPFARSGELFARAANVIPGGIYGHVSPAAVLPQASPYYAERAKGPYYWDVDGRRYIDFVCGYGPIVLGYQNEEIEAAAAEQRAKGTIFNHPTARMVELAEKLCTLIDFADWAVFAKNGSDVTTWAIQVAREHTKRKRIAKVAGAYHGVDPWCSPGYGGVLPEDRALIDSFPWNDVEAIQELFEKQKDDLAAVIITPYHHPVFADQVFGDPEFFAELRRLCDQHGVILILDDIRAGFRLSVHGSHCVYGIDPDIACYCKAMANGYAISSCVGKHEYKIAASKVFLTGSYGNDAVAMAAALKCIEILERDDVPGRLERAGSRWIKRLISLAEQYEVSLRASGPSAAPFIRVDDDADFLKTQAWAASMIAEGVFIHPHHNGFMSWAHTDAVIDEALELAGRGFSRLVGATV
ncbi:MAG: aminotransferase class III-fold pyridoxal phosphate-dependent enzyme [Verrucomicrobiota bacterium]